jgi:hypothetical protein
MILQTFDNGWGPEWPAKQFEKGLVDCMLHELINNDSRTVIINSTWYSQEYHQTVLAQLRIMQFSHIVLVAMLDPAIPQPDWFSEFDCKIVCIGYYPGPYNIDYWALFTHKYNHDVASMSADQIDTAYMCLNRKTHWHRRRLYQQLVNLDLVDQGLVSFGHEHSLTLDCEHDNLAPEAEPDKFGAPNDIASLGHLDNWNRCFLNVVTETVWDITQTSFVSEKIHKPIVGCRPFLVYDPDGAVHWLSDQGFETYVDDFTDITDLDLSIPNNLPKFLQTLCAQPKIYWQKKFVDLQDKILYNKNQFDQYVEQQRNLINKGIQCQI